MTCATRSARGCAISCQLVRFVLITASILTRTSLRISERFISVSASCFERWQAGLPSSRVKNQQPIGDTAPEEFRKQLHQLADWIADFREHMHKMRVAPNEEPGNIRAQLPRQGPENGESFARI